MSDHCKSCMPEFDDLVGITSQKMFKRGLAAVVLCEGCGVIQVDPEGYCLGDCKEYFSGKSHICGHCPNCVFHNPNLWQKIRNKLYFSFYGLLAGKIRKLKKK